MGKVMCNLILLGVFFFTIGCTYHVNPPKFDIDSNLVKPFSGNSVVNIIGTGLNKGERAINYHEMKTSPRTILVDFNQVTKNSVEQIKGELIKNGIRITDNAERQIRFTANNVEWERWAGGAVIAIYFEFEVETTAGYKKKYLVQGGSPANIDRALGGAITKAVEAVLQDERIISYIQYGQ